MPLVDADNGHGTGGDFAGYGKECAVAAEDDDEVAVFAQVGFADDVAADGILNIDAAFFYANFVQIDGKAVSLQELDEGVGGVLDFGGIGAGYDTDVVKRAVHRHRVV